MSSNFLLAWLCYFSCSDVSVLAFRLKHSAQAVAKGPFVPPVSKYMPVKPVQKYMPGKPVQKFMPGIMPVKPVQKFMPVQMPAPQMINPFVATPPQNLMPQQFGFQVPQPQVPQPQQVTTDIRGNDIQSTIGESLWAVRVISASGHPNQYLPEYWPGHWSPGKQSNMDLMWEWIKAMQDNGKNGYIPFKLSSPMDEEAKLRNHYPAVLVGALHTGHNFKNGHDVDGNPTLGMDFYIMDRFEGLENVRCIMPDGRSVSMEARHETVRAEPMFEFRGRIELGELPDYSHRKQRILQRQASFENFDAGITMLEFMPQEAKGFFNVPVLHGGKNYNVRTRDQWNSSAHFAQIGAPFIAGPSGSIEYLILSMEDNCAGACKDGLIPYQKHRIREALIGLMTAALVAGGHHSITECLAVAQAMGYFKKIPDVLQDYRGGVNGFESYLSSLGVAQSVKPTVALTRQIGENRGGENQQRGGNAHQQQFVPSNVASLEPLGTADKEKTAEPNTDKREIPDPDKNVVG